VPAMLSLPWRLTGNRRARVLVVRLTREAEQTAGTDRPPRFLENPKVTAPTSKDPGGTALPGRYRRAGAAPACAHGRGSHGETNFGAEWAGSDHTLSTLRPGGRPTRTQDSLPVVGQTLPGGLEGPLGSSERFLRCFLHRFPPFPGLPWRKRASVRPTAVDQTEARKRRTERARSAAKEPCLGLTNHVGLGPTGQPGSAYFRVES